jgi:hypothetical protein
VAAQFLVADPLAGARLISFRYHVISIAAVFLALVLGIVAGSTVVRGPLVDSLRTNIKSAEHNLQAVSDENKRLSGDLGRYQEVDRAMASGVIGPLTDGLLDDVDVVLIASGVDSGDLRTMRDAITNAGARVVEDVRLDDSLALANPDTVSKLAAALGEPVSDAASLRSKVVESLATALTPVSLASAAAATAATSTSVFGTTTTRASGATTTTIPVSRALVDLRTTIDELAGAGFVKVEDRIESAPRTYTRLVILGAPGATPVGEALCYPLLDRLARIPPFAVAVETKPVTSQAGRGDFIRGVRNDERLRGSVSTVDDGDLWAGRLAVVLALNALTGGTVGQYGVGDGADAVFPPLSP